MRCNLNGGGRVADLPKTLDRLRNMAIAASDARKLYRALIRHGGRFADYNFREYVLRRTRDDFRAMM